MKNGFSLYKDRMDAGIKLAAALKEKSIEAADIFAIPRGGVVVASEIADIYGIPIDVVVPRKLGAPNQNELAIGAVASWGNTKPLIDKYIVDHLRVSQGYIEQEIENQINEAHRRLLYYRGSIDPPDIKGHNILVIDDGIATGNTTKAAILSLRNLGASRIILAVPVGPADTIKSVMQIVDDVVCPKIPEYFNAVGQWYDDFRQISDEDVIEILNKKGIRSVRNQ